MPITLGQQIQQQLAKTNQHGTNTGAPWAPGRPGQASPEQAAAALREPNLDGKADGELPYVPKDVQEFRKVWGNASQYASTNGNLGINQTKPTILYVSDFIPIFENDSLNSIGNALSIKEQANLISAKNAIHFLANNADLRKEYLEKNLNSIKNQIDKKSIVVSDFLQKLRKITNLFNLKAYKLDASNDPDFIDLLTESSVGGFNKNQIERNYSQTKLWATFMWRLYHVCESYITVRTKFGMTDEVLTSRYETGSNLYDVKILEFEKNDRMWLNSNVFNFSGDHLKDAILVKKYLFKKIDTSERVSADILNNATAKDAISFLSIILAKEARYSNIISDDALLEASVGNTSVYADTKLLKSGESPQKSLWRRHIGNITDPNILVDPYKSVGSKIYDTPLLGMAYYYVEENTNKYEVRTFEEDFLESAPISPGHVYFLDTKGAINDPKDLSRGAKIGNMGELINKIDDADKKVKRIVRMNAFENASEKSKQFINPEQKISKIAHHFKWLIKENYLNRQRYDLRGSNRSVTSEFKLWQRAAFSGKHEKTGFHFSTNEEVKTSQQQQIYTALINACAKNVGYLSGKKNTLKDILFAALYSEIINDPNVNVVVRAENANTMTERESSDASALTTTVDVATDVNTYYLRFLETAFQNANEENIKNLPVYDDKALQKADQQRLPLFYIDSFPWKKQNKKETLAQSLFSAGGGLLFFKRWGSSDQYSASHHYERILNFGSGFINSSSVATLRKLMKEEYEFVGSRCMSTSLMDRAATAYSRTQIKTYMYAYFELLLRAHSEISSVVLTELQKQAIYAEDDPPRKSLIHTEIFGVFDLQVNALKAQYNSYYSDDPKTNAKDTYFDWESGKISEIAKAVDNANAYTLSVHLKEAYRLAETETNITKKFVDLLEGYTSDLKAACVDFSAFITGDLSAYVNDIQKTVDKKDPGIPFEVNSKIRSDALSPEQLYLNSYIASETRDKIEDSETFEKLKKISVFNDIQTGLNWTKLLPRRDIELISFSSLSPFFKSPEFLKQKAHNAKILGIGIPPKLIRRIKERRGINRALASDNIFKIKVFKINRLYPDLVFLPQEFNFQINRFPTRVLKNWDLNKITDDIYNLAEIPTKICENDAKIIVHSDKNASDTYFDSKNFLVSNSPEVSLLREQLYTNQVKSFLLGEYIRWFTGMNFDEERYFHFSDFEREDSDTLYQKNLVKSQASSVLSQGGKTLSYTSDGVTYYVPVTDKLSGTVTEQEMQNILSTEESVVDNTSIDVGEDLERYLRNDTFLLGYWEHSRQISYPKKFDRVFNILIDPDDFTVDITKPGLLIDGDILKKYESTNLISIDRSKKIVKMKEMSAEDIAFDEYFVTIESYNSIVNWQNQ